MAKFLHCDVAGWIQRAMVLILVGSVLWFVVRTVPWRITGDASLMHYVTFLIAHGRAPYREIGDINLPMSYAPTWLVDRLFEGSDLAWRIYDLALLLAVGVAMFFIARPYGAFPAVWAGCLFALIHGRDGLLQVGQRDLFAAMLVIGGVAFLFAALRGNGSWLAAGFGICVGAAAMVKPPFALFLLLAFVAHFSRSKSDHQAAKRLLFGVAGWLAPVLGCVGWLKAKGSLKAFWCTLTVVGPYHARIGHAPIKFLLSNSVSPITWLLAAWAIVRLSAWARARDRRPYADSVEQNLLLLAAGLGYLSYLVQQRGYPYHRYPFQVFMLLVMAIDFIQALRSASWVRWMGAAALVWGAVVMAPVSAVKAGRYEWRPQPFRNAMEADLLRVTRERGVASLDGRVQCLDSISGCVATLDAMGIVQSTGVMYDEFLFNPGGVRVIDDARAGFLKDLEGKPPLVFVMSAPLFPAGPDEYRKLDQWPEFREWLVGRYVLDAERTFTVAVREAAKAEVPLGYRIYVLK